MQAKMVEITKLVKAAMLQDEDDETTEYAKQVNINGLCGGWVKMFMQYPDWVEPVYNAVRTWERKKDVSDAKALIDFEKHLKKTTRFAGAEHVVKLLRDAYDTMSELEPEAGYDAPPDWTDLDVGTLPAPATASDAVEETNESFRLRGKNAAKVVCGRVQDLTKADRAGECMVHIESDLHHMALRVQKRPKKKSKKLGLVITVVETEKRGIVKVETWPKAQSILNEWLAEDEPDLSKIQIRTKRTGF